MPEMSIAHLLETTDAVVWTDAFMLAFRGQVIDDEFKGTILGWFANAIETGRAAGQISYPVEGQPTLEEHPPSPFVNLAESMRDPLGAIGFTAHLTEEAKGYVQQEILRFVTLLMHEMSERREFGAARALHGASVRYQEEGR